MRKIPIKHCEYSLRKKSATVYDLVGCKKNSNIPFIRVELPKEDFLKNHGAKYVIQSFKGGKKTLFTGLISLGRNFYYGDNINSKGKKDFLIVYYNRIRKSNVQVYIFKNRNPRNNKNSINALFEHLNLMGLLLHTF